MTRKRSRTLPRVLIIVQKTSQQVTVGYCTNSGGACEVCPNKTVHRPSHPGGSLPERADNRDKRGDVGRRWEDQRSVEIRWRPRTKGRGEYSVRGVFYTNRNRAECFPREPTGVGWLGQGSISPPGPLANHWMILILVRPSQVYSHTPGTSHPPCGDLNWRLRVAQ